MVLILCQKKYYFLLCCILSCLQLADCTLHSMAVNKEGRSIDTIGWCSGLVYYMILVASGQVYYITLTVYLLVHYILLVAPW